jgi:DNA-3-methyladenine glycosylase I
MSEISRCFWAGTDPLYVQYHDEEWGVPVYDDRELFERLLLEGFQAGLSWRTILYKRDNFRRAFDSFDIDTIAAYDESKIARLLEDPGIVRNRLKVRAAVRNAQSAQRIILQEGSLSRYLWSFTGGAPLLPDRPLTERDIRSTSPEAEAMSKALLKQGMTFVGPTICYAFMQSVGMVNDHHLGCFRYAGPPGPPTT